MIEYVVREKYKKGVTKFFTTTTSEPNKKRLKMDSTTKGKTC